MVWEKSPCRCSRVDTLPTTLFSGGGGRIQAKVGSAVGAAIIAGARAAATPVWNRWAYLAIGLAFVGGLFLASIAVGKWVLR